MTQSGRWTSNVTSANEYRIILRIVAMAEKNVFTLNWRQAFVDVFLIVIGVSIALAADSWLSDRNEHARTNQLLDSLEDEWTLELERIEAHLDVLNRSKTTLARVIEAHDNSPEDLSDHEAVALLEGNDWITFKASSGAHSTLMADGIQNVGDSALRQAIASWSSVLAEVGPEQAALGELGTRTERSISVTIARNSGERFSQDAMEDDFWSYGMESGAFARAAIANDEWVAYQHHILNLLYSYQIEMAAIRDTLERNLTLLRERARN